MKKILAVMLVIMSCLAMLGCSKEDISDPTYRTVKKQIISELDDPGSYKMEYVRYNKNKTCMKVKFRSKNSYGAMELGYAYVILDTKHKPPQNKVFILGSDSRLLDEAMNNDDIQNFLK